MGTNEKNQKEVQPAKSGKADYTFVKTMTCKKCRVPMKYIYGEEYECPICGQIELSDFGKVKKYLDENGPQTAMKINEDTGVSLELIDEFLRNGRIEIPDGSDRYIKCQKCGTDIRYGRFCPECSLKMAKELDKAFIGTVIGEKPTKPSSSDMNGKMHALGDVRLKRKK